MEQRTEYKTEQPPQLDKLAAALAKAQAEFQPVSKTGANPHLRTEYATLDDIINAIRKPLCNHGLSFVQLLGSNGAGVTLRTILLHESGQTLESTVVIDAATEHRGINALQALGAAITYMKRYSLTAMLGISADGDTDGEGARKAQPQKAPAKAKAKPRAEGEEGEGESGPEESFDGGPTNPKDLYENFNPLEYYKSIPHMLQGLRKQRNEKDLQWGTGAEWYAEALEDLTEYAKAQLAQTAIEQTAKARRA